VHDQRLSDSRPHAGLGECRAHLEVGVGLHERVEDVLQNLERKKALVFCGSS
jgi:hypothetical protein